MRQVCVVERTRRVHGAETTESVFYITSLPPDEASPSRLLRLIRSHWRIENELHHVRDVSAGEDACRVKTVLRASGEANIAAAFRRLAAIPEQAIELVTQFVLRLL